MEAETNREDISKEEDYLHSIISACECILDDLDNGANLEQADFNNLGYADAILFRIQKNVNKQMQPSNINETDKDQSLFSFYLTGDRALCDDEHGNVL